jgi:hypothetical protein
MLSQSLAERHLQFSLIKALVLLIGAEYKACRLAYVSPPTRYQYLSLNIRLQLDQ